MKERIRTIVALDPREGQTAEMLVERLTEMIEAAQEAHEDNFKADRISVHAEMN